MTWAQAGEIELQADHIDYDQQKQRYIAKGNVLILRDGHQLQADQIEYDYAKGIIYAIGAVQFTSDDGHALFADRLEIDDTLLNERAYNLRIRTAQDVRMAAQRMHTSDSGSRHFEYFIYSPCSPCQQNPAVPPTWQLKSAEAVHDLRNREYILRHSVIELAGWPIIYTPYFRYPDTTVKRRSGILTPDIGVNSHAGVFITVPYFVALGLDKNLTITPTVMSKGGRIVALDYQQALDDGQITLEVSGGSFTLPEQSSQRTVAHLNAKADFLAPEGLRYGTTLQYTSDFGYISSVPSFDYTDFRPLYSSRVYIDSPPPDQPRNLYRASMVHYKDNRLMSQNIAAPEIVPTLQGKIYFPNDTLGGRLALSAEARHIQQKDLADSSNVNLTVQYRLRHIYAAGIVADYQASLDVNYYDYQRSGSLNNTRRNDRGVTTIPRLSAEWRLPFYRDSPTNDTSVLSPVIMLSAAPGSHVSEDIPLQDSASLSDARHSLYAKENFTGHNLQYQRTKLVTAIEWQHMSPDTQSHVSLLFGRAFESQRDQDAQALQYEARHEDYVVELQGYWADKGHYTLTNRLGKNGQNNSSLWSVALEESLLGVAPELRYTYRRADLVHGVVPLSQGYAGLSRSLGEFWTISGSMTYDLETSNKLREGRLAVEYEDESLHMSVYLRRHELVTPSLEKDDTLGITFGLKFGMR